MSIRLTLTALACALPLTAHADDCSAVKTAMVAAMRAPHSATISRVQDGKTVTNRMVQTRDARYFEVNGTWRAMPFSPDEANAMERTLNTSNLSCTRIGTDKVDGQAATVYTAHIKNEDMQADAKLWLGTNGLPLRVDNQTEAGSYSTSFDYTHTDPPAGAKPMTR